MKQILNKYETNIKQTLTKLKQKVSHTHISLSHNTVHSTSTRLQNQNEYETNKDK